MFGGKSYTDKTVKQQMVYMYCLCHVVRHPYYTN